MLFFFLLCLFKVSKIWHGQKSGEEANETPVNVFLLITIITTINTSTIVLLQTNTTITITTSTITIITIPTILMQVHAASAKSGKVE